MKTKIAFVGGALLGGIAAVAGVVSWGVVKYRKPGETYLGTLVRVGDECEEILD